MKHVHILVRTTARHDATECTGPATAVHHVEQRAAHLQEGVRRRGAGAVGEFKGAGCEFKGVRGAFKGTGGALKDAGGDFKTRRAEHLTLHQSYVEKLLGAFPKFVLCGGAALV